MGENGSREVTVQSALLRRTAPSALQEQVTALFDQHRARVFRAAYRVTGSEADAEDVLQTVFLRLLKQEDAVIEEQQAGSYLHRAAVNAAVDVLRRRRMAKDEPLGERQDHLPDPAPDPAAALDAKAAGRRLRAALAELSPRAAEIFVLRYFEGYRNREIARMLGASWSTVAVTLHRARARLRKTFLGGMR